MEQEKELDMSVLSLEDVETCANRVLEKLVPGSEKGIRRKCRRLNGELICRYCYFKMAYSINDPSKRDRVAGKTSKVIKQNKFSMMDIVEYIKLHGKNHSSVVWGIRSIDNMLVQKHPIAVSAWEDMQNEVYKMLIKKEHESRATKRLLIGRI